MLLPGDLQYAIYHVFLPPNLPQTGDDPQAVSHETVLLAVVSDALRRFICYVDPGVQDAIDAGYFATLRLRDLRDSSGFVSEEKLRDMFTDLVQKGN